jgi:hypothetical protein
MNAALRIRGVGARLCWPDQIASPEPSCHRRRWAPRARSAASLMVARGMLRGRCGCVSWIRGRAGGWLAGPRTPPADTGLASPRGRSAPDVWPTFRNHAPAQVGGPVGGGVDVDGGRHPGAVLHGSIRFNEASARWFRGTTAWPWTGECSCSSRVLHRISAPQTAILGLSGARVQ